MAEDLTEGGILKTILRTSLPMIVAFFLQSVFNIVDAFFVGKISPEALAAVSISYPVVFLLISLGSGIGAGTASVISRFIGAKKQKEADNAAEHAVLSALVLGAVLGIIGLLTAPALFDLMGTEPQVKTLALGYLNIILYFAGFMLLAMVGNSILRGEGDMLTPMKVMAFSAILNMVLDPIFIFHFGLGVEGAAMATVLSRAVGFVYLLYYIFAGKASITLDLKDFSYNFDYIRKIFSVGIPSSISNLTISVRMFLLTAMVAFFGTNALAAFGVGFRLNSLAVLPALGIPTAVISIVGQSIGARKSRRAEEVTLKSGAIASGFMVLIGIFFYLCAPHIISIFNSEPGVIKHGVSFLRIIPLSYIVLGFIFCLSGAFFGSGRGLIALTLNSFRAVIFAVPAAYLLSMVYGVSGIWMGIVLGSFLSFLVGMVLFKFTDWEKSRI